MLQRNNIHIKVCPEGEVTATLAALRAEPRHRASEGQVHPRHRRQDASRPKTSSTARPSPAHYADFPDHFGFFLPLAGITTVKQIRENAFDIKATGRLNRLYVELLEGKPGLGHGGPPARPEPLLRPADLLLLRRRHRHLPRRRACSPHTVEQMSERDSNTHEVLAELSAP